MIKNCISEDWEIRSPNGVTQKKDLPDDFSVSLERRADASGGGGNGYFVGGKGKYTKYFPLPDGKEHYILDIEGAYCHSEVFLNDDIIAFHNHGYTPFLVDLTEKGRRGRQNKLVITVDDLQPSTRWYSGAGLYRDVYLWSGGIVRIEPWDLFITTESVKNGKAEIKFSYTITSDIKDIVQIFGQIVSPYGDTEDFVLCADVVPGKNQAEFTVFLNDPLLWDTENPNIYTLNTTLQINGETTDTCTDTFGIRTFTVDSERGFVLNGKPMKLRGGCMHHTHGALGAEDHPEAIARELCKLKSVGYNALRSSHNPPSANLLELCDKLGIILMDEAFDMWNLQKNNNDYHLWFEQSWADDIKSMVKHGRNHPCVISYSIGNEIPEKLGVSDGAKWSDKLSAEIRKYDTTRLVTSAIDFGGVVPLNYDKTVDKAIAHAQWLKLTHDFTKPLDIVGYNYLHDFYEFDHKLYPERVMWGSETWALTIYDSWKATMENNYVIGDFCWTCYDTLGESGTGRFAWARDGFIDNISLADFDWISCFQGDFDLAGYRRPQSYYREAIWMGNQATHKIFTTHPEHFGEGFSGTRWHFYDVHETWTFDDSYLGRPVKVETYTMADEVIWYLNGKKLGISVPEKAIASITVPYEKGILSATYVKDGNEYESASLETVGEAVSLLVNEDNYLCNGSENIFYFNISAVDEQGRIVTNCTDKIECFAENAEILGVFSGDPKAKEKLSSNVCELFEGTAVACLRGDDLSSIKIMVDFKK